MNVDEMIAELERGIAEVHSCDPSMNQTSVIIDVATAEGIRDYIVGTHKVLGSPCPKCGHWLKVEHGRSFNPPTRQTNFYCKHRDGKDQCDCEFPVAELSLTPAPTVAQTEVKRG